MSKITLFLSSLLLILGLTACSSKTETDVINSGSKDVSDLLRTLIQKEKEINELNKQLEACKQSKSR
jgi:hypothetical protein